MVVAAPGVKCHSCDQLGSLRQLVDGEGRVVGEGFACDECMVRALDEAAMLHMQFVELVRSGVSVAEANRIMIDRMEGRSRDG